MFLSPVEITKANIRKWIHDGDLESLETVVLEGQGEKLIAEPARSKKVSYLFKLMTILIKCPDLNVHMILTSGASVPERGCTAHNGKDETDRHGRV